MKTPIDNYDYCADLLDDLTAKQLTALINYMAISGNSCRATIKQWRVLSGLKP